MLLLTWIAFALLVTLVLVKATVFLTMMRKMRWLLIVMLVLYAFTTPGEYLPDWPFWTAPTYEGMRAGGLQTLRLITMLAGLALLLRLTDRDKLIVGLYTMLQPLRHLKLDPERFTARLWLTLYYVEQPQQPHTAKAMFERLRDFQYRDEEDQTVTISLDARPFGMLDYMVLFVVLVLGIALL